MRELVDPRSHRPLGLPHPGRGRDHGAAPCGRLAHGDQLLIAKDRAGVGVQRHLDRSGRAAPSQATGHLRRFLRALHLHTGPGRAPTMRAWVPAARVIMGPTARITAVERVALGSARRAA